MKQTVETDSGFKRGTTFGCPICDEAMFTIWGWYNIYLSCLFCDVEAKFEIKNPNRLWEKINPKKIYYIDGLG